MSRDFMEDYLQHSWGKKPEQKAREKQYNAEYYKKHKDKWEKESVDNTDYRARMNGMENYRREDTGADKKSKAYYLKAVTEATKNPDKTFDGKSLDHWQKMYKWSERSLNAKQKYNQSIASKRAAAGAAENERSKAKDNALRQRDRNQRKEQERRAYENSTKGKIEKKTKDTIYAGKKFVSNLLDKIF